MDEEWTVHKILITGGAGFISYHLTTKLLQQDCEIWLVDNFSRGVNDHALENLLSSKRVHIVSADVMDPGFMRELPKDFDFVFHLAAIIGVQNVLKQPYRVLQANTEMLINMIRVCEPLIGLKRFVFASTSEVYAGTLQHHLQGGMDLRLPTPESTVLALPSLQHARTSYMLSKIYGEALCLQSGLPITIVRPHNFYGPRMGLSHVIPELLQKAYRMKDSDELEVFSIDHQRTFCYIEDAVEMMVRAAQSPQCQGEQLNIGCQAPEVKIGALAQLILDTVGRKARLKAGPETPGSPTRRCPDMTKTLSLIGYEPRVSLEEGVRRTYDWYRENVFESRSISAI